MDDLVKTIKAQLYDRLSSPLIFSFCVSWLAWNYRFLLVLLSSLTPLEKFSLIEGLFKAYEYPTLVASLHLIVGPACTTLLYLFVLPRIELAVFKFTLLRKKELKDARQSIEDTFPISQEEATELRAVRESLYSEHRAILKERDEEIAALKVSLRELKKELTEGKNATNFSETDIKLSADQQHLLQLVAENPDDNDLMFGTLVELTDNKPIKVQYDLDYLERQLLITSISMSDGTAYELTVKGRAYCIEALSMDLV